MATIQPLHYEISADDKKFLDALVRDGRALNNLTREAQRAGAGIDAAFKKIGAAVGVSFGVAQIMNFAKEVVNVRSQIQMLEQSFTVLLGSKAKADAMLVDIKEIALKSPLSLADTSNAAQTLLSFNIAAEKVIPTLRQLGDISMGNSDRFRSLTLAFAQMSSAGKLMGQDLLQMINAGFNPLQVMSQKTGKSISALREEMSAGAISSEMVAEAFRSATAEGGKFHNMMETQASGIAGLQASLGDAWMNMLNELGEKSEGVIGKGYKMTTALVENYGKIGKAIVALIATYGTYRAAMALNIAVSKGYTVAQLAQYNALLLLEKAQKALNLAMKANPYVLLATVVAGLAVAMWALHDSTSSAERVQKRLNDLLGAAKEKKDKLISTTDELTQKIKDQSATIFEQIKNWRLLQDALPEVYGKMTVEEFRALSDAQIKHRNATAADAREVAEANSKYEEAINKVQRLKAEYDALLENDKSGTSGFYLLQKPQLKAAREEAEAARQALERINEIREEEAFQSKPASERLAYYEAELKKLEEQKRQLEAIIEKSKGVTEQWKGFSTEAAISIGRLDTVNNKINEIGNNILVLKEETSVKRYGDAYKGAKKDWEDAKKALKEIEKDKDKFTVEQHKKAKDRAKATKETYEELGGVTNTKVADRQEKEADRQKREQEKAAEMRLRAAQSIAESDRELSVSREKEMLEGEQKLLDLEEDSFNKRMKQNDLNHRKELAEIKRQAAEKQKKAEEYAKDLYTKETGTDKGFDFSRFDVSKLPEGLRPEDIKAWVTGANEAAGKAFENANKETLKALLEDYMDYAREREEIEKKYNKDIKALTDERAKAVKEGNAAMVAQLDRAIAQATKDKGTELISFDFDMLKKSPDYVRAFENLKDTSTATLNELLTQLNAVKGRAAEVLDPAELQAYTNTIQSIIEELTARDPFAALTASQKELSRSSEVLASARRKLTLAEKGGDPAALAKAQTEYRAALDKTAQANSRVVKAQAEVNTVMEKLYDSLRGVGDAIGGQAGEVIGLIADIGSFATATISAVKTTATGVSAALAAVEKASAILAIIQAAIQILQQINDLMPDDRALYEKYAEKVELINRLTDAANEYARSVAIARQAEENWFSEDRLKSMKDANELYQQATKAYYDKLYEEQARYVNETGNGWLSGPWNYLFDHSEIVQDTVSAIKNLRIETREASKGFLGTGIDKRTQGTEDLTEWLRANGLGELFDKNGMINEELAKAVLDQYSDKLVGETKATLESLVELKERYDEYLEQLHEYVSDLYSPLADNMVSALWDWYDEGKDALDSFKDYAADTFRDIASEIIKTLVLKHVFASFDDDITALYKKYAEGAITEQELMSEVANVVSGLTDRYEAQMPVLKDLVNTIGDVFEANGIDMKQTEASVREGSKGLAASMTQDQATEMNGFLNNGLIFWRDIAHNTGLIVDSLAGRQPDSSELMKSYAQNMLSHLASIDNNTGRLEAIEKDISGINAGMRRITDWGVKMR